MPTTSRPPRPSRSKGRAQRGNPLKRFTLTVTLPDAASRDLIRLATEKGLAVEANGGETRLWFTASTADEALERLRLLSELLAPKG